MRWSLVKSNFSRHIDKEETVTRSREARRERGIWQRRYWEHQIRDDDDLARHVDYIHNNPVKHGYVERAADWQHSSIHRYIKEGLLDENWGYDLKDDSAIYGER
jgi:putative transposase